MPAFNSCTKFDGSPGIIFDRTPIFHPVSWAWMLPQVPDHTTECSFDSQATWVIDFLGLFLIYDVFTIRHWQTSGRLVQEPNACTVANSETTSVAFKIERNNKSV